MATAFLSTAIKFQPSLQFSASISSSSSSSCSSPLIYRFGKENGKRLILTNCKAVVVNGPSPILTKRSLSICFITSFVFSLASKGVSSSNAAILEADDDLELLEKVKKDRKKRLEKQAVVNSAYNKEKGYLQDLVYKLSRVGEAIDNKDLTRASSVLGGSTNSDWVKNVNLAFTKLTSSPEEKTEVDAFNSSLASLISSVTRNDVESSKVAFVSSADAFEKWTTLTGLVEQLKGL